MSFFKNIGANVARAKHSAMVAIGQSEATQDPEFDALAAEFKEAYAKIKQMGKFVVTYQSGVKELGAAQIGMAPMLLEQYDGSDRMYQVANQYKDQVGPHIVELGKAMEQFLADDFHRPLTQYLAQYKTIDERIEERNVRRQDKDRLAEEFRALQARPDTDPTKLQIAKEKAEYKDRAYTDLNTELKRDIPLLLGGKSQFLDALLATFVHAQIQYLQNCSGALQSFYPHFEGVSKRQDAQGWPHVITPPSVSTMNPENAANAAPARQAPPQPGPPQPPRPTSSVVTARALYAFQGQDNSELTFNANDMIVVTRQGGEWWEGELNGRKGLFPSNYVALN